MFFPEIELTILYSYCEIPSNTFTAILTLSFTLINRGVVDIMISPLEGHGRVEVFMAVPLIFVCTAVLRKFLIYQKISLSFIVVHAYKESIMVF
jgi:hypothetical protein